MTKFLVILCALFAVSIAVSAFPDGVISIFVAGIFSFITIALIRRFTDDSKFLIQVFIGALLARLLLGAIIYFFDLYDFFGPDARLYDFLGQKLVETWLGQIDTTSALAKEAARMSGPGWGMNYLTGVIYFTTGQSMLVVQSFCAVVGAATAPMVYFCAKNIYSNQKVARLSALAIAFFPSMIIWSAQMLKDGLIIFLLVVAITMVLQLQKKLSYAALLCLIISLFGIYSLRFYIFYMVTAAVAGSFVVGLSTSTQSLVRRTISVLIICSALAYLGVLQSATTEFEIFGNFERLQISRQAASYEAGSGFVDRGDVDVSTAYGAISILPVGFLYLMLAPFPWEVSNFRQAVTLPEVFIWWALIPLVLSGLWYTLKNQLRTAIPILIFVLLLTFLYSLYQGNVGTAYRQRAQIQVFLFIFIAVGWALRKERKEDKKILRSAKQKQYDRNLQGKAYTN